MTTDPTTPTPRWLNLDELVRPEDRPFLNQLVDQAAELEPELRSFCYQVNSLIAKVETYTEPAEVSAWELIREFTPFRQLDLYIAAMATQLILTAGGVPEEVHL